MQFQSFTYLFAFLPLAVMFFYLLQGTKLRNAVLVMMSFVFYGWREPWAISLIFISAIADYALGQRIYLAEEEWKRKAYLIASLALNLGMLAVFKYWDWLALSLQIPVPLLDVQVPAGISFYTFQTLSYTIDIYRRQFKPRGNFIDYLSFVAFFPHLIAGPIVRARYLLPQLVRQGQRIKPHHLETALFLIFWGVTKKLVFADNFGHLVDRCREHLLTPGAGLALGLAFTFQIYCDFSAYTDIARGSARLFGIRLQRNFLTPFFAQSPSDFWRRWHITLSRWVRDYLYIPLGGNRHGTARTLFNLMLTMFLMGLWHGAGIFFIMWGLYHGLLLAVYSVFPFHRIVIAAFGRVIGKALSISVMFALALLGWIMFWSKTEAQFFSILHSAFALLHAPAAAMTGKLFYGFALFAAPVVITESIGYAQNREFVDLHSRIPHGVRVFLYLAMLYGVIFFGSRGSYDFIYFQF